jgi:hypothetical protein
MKQGFARPEDRPCEAFRAGHGRPGRRLGEDGGGRELHAAEEGQSSASPTASADAVPTEDAARPGRRAATLMQLLRRPVRRTN